MATNKFAGIISKELKQLFNDAINALLEAGACTVPCTFHYGVTKYESCVNCLYDPIGRKSSNRFQNGGPVPFPFGGVCPLCNGAGRRPVISTEDTNLIVIFDYKQFLAMSTPVNHPDGLIQTLGPKELTPNFTRAKEITVSTDIAGYSNHRFQRAEEPQPLGLGNNEFVICTWKRV